MAIRCPCIRFEAHVQGLKMQSSCEALRHAETPRITSCDAMRCMRGAGLRCLVKDSEVHKLHCIEVQSHCVGSRIKRIKNVSFCGLRDPA